jgi:hypothetical protein
MLKLLQYTELLLYHFRKIKYVRYTEQFTIVTILVIGMYGTIYGTHRHRTPDTGHQTPDTGHRTPTF